VDDLKCSKLSFHNFAEHQGWLLLYDKMTEEGSEVGYLLQDGESLICGFDTDGNFFRMTDVTNASITVETNNHGSKSDFNFEEDD